MGFFEELKVKFTGEDGLSGVLSKITGGFGEAGKAGLAMGAVFAIVQKAIEMAQKALQLLVQFLADSVKAYVDFEVGLARISTLLSDTSPMEGYAAAMRKMAIDTGTSISSIEKGLYQVLSAGIDTGNAMDVLTVANKTSVATMSDLGTSIDAITTVMNAYGYSASETTKISDMLFTASTKCKTSFEAFTGSFGPIAELSSNLGIKLEDVIAALITMTQHGIKSTTAMTGLRTIFSQILDPSAKVKQVAADIGIQFDMTALKSRGLAGFMSYVSNACKAAGIDINELFPGVRSLTAVLALGGDNAVDFANNLNLISNSAGSTETAFQKMEGTTAHAMEQMQAKIADTQIEIGEKMIPVTMAWQNIQVGVATALGIFIDKLGDFWDAIKPIRDAIGELIDAVLPLFIDAWTAVTTVLGILYDNIFKPIGEFLGKVFAVVLSVITTAVNLVRLAFQTLWNAIKPLAEWLIKTFKPVIDALIGAFNSLKDAIGGAIDAVGGAWDAFSGWVDEQVNGKKATEEVAVAVQHTSEYLTEFASRLAEVVRLIGDYDTNIEKATGEIKTLEDANKGLIDKLKDLKRIDQITTSLNYMKKSSTDAAYAHKIFDNELRQSQIELLRTKDLIQGLKNANDEYSDKQAENSLEISKIRYKARLENRELTEAETKRIDELELENEGLRIKVDEENIKIDDIEDTTLKNQQDRVDERIRQLEDEKEALKEKSGTEITRCQDEIDANNRAIKEKLAAINQWVIDRDTLLQTSYKSLMDELITFNSFERKEIEKQSGLKLDEIDDFITTSESKWRTHYEYLSGLGKGEVVESVTYKEVSTPTEKTVVPVYSTSSNKKTIKDIGSQGESGRYFAWISSSAGDIKKFYTNTLKEAFSKSGELRQQYPIGGAWPFQQGGYVPKDLYAFLHAGEYVLPKKIVELIKLLRPKTVPVNVISTISKQQTGAILPFQQGGFVPKNLLAFLHAGEYVLPKKIVELLNSINAKPTLISNIPIPQRQYQTNVITPLQKGGFIPNNLLAMLHAGEYVLPKKVVDMLDSLVAKPVPVNTISTIKEKIIEKHTSETRSGGDIYIYGNITLPQVQNVDQFMKELQRRARNAGARL